MTNADSLSAAERFFYDHAGTSFNPATETHDEGRIRGARRLAAAEQRMTAGPYYIDVTPDDMPWDGDVPYDGPIWVVTLYSTVDETTPNVLGSLGGVATESSADAYIRVVAAELAAEHIPMDDPAPTAIFDQGDKLPALVVTVAYRLLPGDQLWGWQADNPRKGWILESEPTEVTEPPRPHGPDYVLAGKTNYALRRDCLVLVRDNRVKA